MAKEYELIQCQEYGVHYKRWVWVRARATYLGLEVFLHREAHGWVVTHYHSGRSIGPPGKVSPYPGGIVTYLDKVLTTRQKEHAKLISGLRLYLAYQYSTLCGLPTLRQARATIQQRREELWKLEEIIIGGGLPF